MLKERLEQFFKEDYLWLSQAIMTPERTQAEVAAVQEWLNLAKGATLLDLGCGQGRISLPLAEAGYQVTGVDYSTVSLEYARTAADARGLATQVEFIHGLMADLHKKEIYDAALSMGTAIGYLEEEEDVAAFHNVFNALKPGGVFLIETENRDFKVHSFSPRRWDDMGGVPVWSERQYYPVSGRWVENIRWLKEGQVSRSVLDVRLYSASELGRLLTHVGFTNIQYYGGLHRQALELSSPRMVVTACKPEIESN